MHYYLIARSTLILKVVAPINQSINQKITTYKSDQ